MLNKITRLLVNEDLSLDVRKVILANYFSEICSDDSIMQLLGSRKLNPDIKGAIIDHYRVPSVVSDASIHKRLVPILRSLLSSADKHEKAVLSHAISTLAAYRDGYLIENLTTYLGAADRDMSFFYGILAEYLIDMIFYDRTLIVKIAEMLYKNGTETATSAVTVSLKLLLDVIYTHYRLHPIYVESADFHALLGNLGTSARIEDFQRILEQFCSLSSIDGICLLDVNKKLKIINYNNGFNDGYQFRKHPVNLDERGLVAFAISGASPVIVNQKSDATGFLTQFSEDFSQALIVPCLYYSDANTVLILLKKTRLDIREVILGFVLAKYIAGNIARFREDLDIYKIYHKFVSDSTLLIRGLLHDLNKSIGSMENYIYAIRHDRALKQAQHLTYLENCEKACTTMNDSIESVLSLFDPRKVTVNVNGSISNILRVLEYAINKHRISLSIHLDPLCPNIVISPGYLSRIFLNIIDNAINILAIQDGEKNIEVKSLYLKDSNTIVISIRDNGPGVREEIKQDIFKPDVSTFQGGLGLSIAEGFVKEMGGRIEFETSNDGTIFYIYIPVKEV